MQPPVAARTSLLSIPEATIVFTSSFGLTVIASVVLSRRIQQLGAWLAMSQSLLGIVAALGADAPEISSSITALRSGNHDLGLGIVLGSNIFNLAALMGVGALVSGRVKVARGTLAVNGGVALAVLGVASAQMFGIVPGSWSLTLIGLIMVAYVTLISVPERVLRTAVGRLGFPMEGAEAREQADKDSERGERPPRPGYADLLGIVPALASIVLGSVGMVDTATLLGGHFHVSNAVVGTLVLAVLTGLPNVVTAVALALRGRGSAVVSEALNSNTLNLIVGGALPAVLMGVGHLSSVAVLSFWWLIAMTVLALGICFARHGLGRAGGGLLAAIYVVFAIVVIVLG